MSAAPRTKRSHDGTDEHGPSVRCDAMDAAPVTPLLLALGTDLLRLIAEQLDKHHGTADAFVFALVCTIFRESVCAPRSLTVRFPVVVPTPPLGFRQDRRRTVLARLAVRSLGWLQWAQNMGYTWDAQTCSEAVAGDHLDVLGWAYENLWTDWFRKHYCPNEFAAHAPDLSRDDLFELLGIGATFWDQLITNLDDGEYVRQLPNLLTNSRKNLVPRKVAYERARKWAKDNTYDPTEQLFLRMPARHASTMAFQTALQQLRERAGLRAVIQLVLALAARKARHTMEGTNEENWQDCGPDAGASVGAGCE